MCAPSLELVPKDLLHPGVNAGLRLGEAGDRRSAPLSRTRNPLPLRRSSSAGARLHRQADRAPQTATRMQIDGVRLAVFAALLGDGPLASVQDPTSRQRIPATSSRRWPVNSSTLNTLENGQPSALALLPRMPLSPHRRKHGRGLPGVAGLSCRAWD